MSDRFLELRAFRRAAESGSFSRAARELGLSQPSVSRLVADLERRLGTRLLLRTTRRVSATEAGLAYLERARAVLDELDAADAEAAGAGALRGLLRVGLPVTLGVREVVPRLGPFLDAHPELRVDLLMDERHQDLVGEGVDLALRVGRPADSSFAMRRLGAAERLVVAAPAYLERHGAPRIPADLAAHACVLGPGHSGAEAWAFGHPTGARLSVEVRGRVRVAAAEGVTAAAKAGLGVAIASRWMCARELAAGELVALLPGYALDPVELVALFPAGRRVGERARAFADHLAASLSGDPPPSADAPPRGDATRG